jgi:hypothetical protein
VTAQPGQPDATAVIPLFPLGLVLVPGMVLPLHVFEPRYRTLVARLLERPHAERVFGVVAIREGHEVGADAVRALHHVGCTARLVQASPSADGTIDVMTMGTRRFALEAVHHDEPYATGTVTWLAEPDGDLGAEPVGPVLAAFEAYREALSAASGSTVSLGEPLPEDPAALSYLLTSALVVDLAERQGLLEVPDTAGRLAALRRVLRRETALASALPSLPAGDLARTAVSLN